MATPIVTQGVTPEAEPAPRPVDFQFKPVLLSPNPIGSHPIAQSAWRFASTARDVANGVGTLVRLMEWNETRRDAAEDEDDPDERDLPVLNDFHRGHVVRLIAASLDLLGEEAARACEHLSSYAKESRHG